MLRRNALKNISLITGGVFFLPYSCDLNPDFIHPVLGLKTSELLDELEIRDDIVDINFSLED